MTETAAIIDVGSNSIKLLVASRDTNGVLKTIDSATLDTRISAGIGGSSPKLSDAGMNAGIQAILSLLKRAGAHSPSVIDIVATSAVRSAVNGSIFAEQVQKASGHRLRILPGEEEARLIGRGITSDPALTDLQDFCLFDLGGGSLECIAFSQRRPIREISLPLGCVRLTERFVPDSSLAIAREAKTAIASHVQSSLDASDFDLSLGRSGAVFAGGSMTTIRAILGGGRIKEASSPLVSVSEIQRLSEQACSLPLAERIRTMPGLPAPRADVFPAALITILTIAGAGSYEGFLHSFQNLRFGLAAELLQ